MSSLDTESLAESLAGEGRDELTDRFREAYAKALGTQADLVSLDSEQLEAMIQRSVAEADGLQWRRALAGVAARELGIDLGTALVHPAVARAHQLAGAPSYESALAALALPQPVASREPEVAVPVAAVAEPVGEPVAEPVGEPDAVVEVSAVEPEPQPEPEADRVDLPAADVPLTGVDQPTMAYDVMGAEGAQAGAEDEAAPDEEEPSDEQLAHRADEFAQEFLSDDAPPFRAISSVPSQPVDPVSVEPAAEEPPAAPARFERSPAPAEPAPTEIADDFTYEHDAVAEDLPAEDYTVADADSAEFDAVHLGGVAALPTSEEIVLRLSEDGLDLLQRDGDIVGRLGWSDIASIEVTVPHARRRRRGAPRLVVHTAGGSARFEVEALSGEELQGLVQPLMDRFGH